ncbi:hypothetical protein QL285_076572 [Trifolium repens]|nr:hypothetical protein QL285_076572 [Trifolium repens]
MKCKALQQMVLSPVYGNCYVGNDLNFPEWGIEEARGIPNCGHSDNAAVWVVDWMEMAQNFSPNIQGELKGNLICVKTAWPP